MRGKVAAAGLCAAAIAIAWLWVGRGDRGSAEPPLAPLVDEAAVPAVPGPAPAGQLETTPLTIQHHPLQLHASVAPRALRPQQPELTPRQRNFAAIAQRIEANPRLAPFLHAARKLKIDGEREEQLIVFLGAKAPFHPPRAPADVQEALRAENQTYAELWTPLQSILGSGDASMLLPEVLREVTQRR
jgi:hypothetical protein